jgi:hypothetical protein
MPDKKKQKPEDPAAAMPQEASEETEKLIDAGSELSFPASDPPSYMGGSAIIGPPPSTHDEPPREPPITEVSDPEGVTPTKLDLPKGAARSAEKADLTKAATEAGDEDDEDDQNACAESMTRNDRDR